MNIFLKIFQKSFTIRYTGYSAYHHPVLPYSKWHDFRMLFHKISDGGTHSSDFSIWPRYSLQFVFINTIYYCELELLGNYCNHVCVYFEGNEVLNRDEQRSVLEQMNNKQPSLTEMIFTVLSYCTLSPKSLGIAFETYMEKKQLWNSLYNMTGFTRLAAQAVSIVISKLPTVIACLPPPIKYFFFLAERKMSRNFAELRKAGLLVWNLIVIICRIFEDGNTAELLTGATLDRWSKEKLSLVRVCLESIMGKQKSGPKQVTQKVIQSIEQQRPNWIESQLLKARKLSTDCASVTVEGATLEEGGIALGFTEQKINMMVLDICHKPGGSEYLRQIYHIIRLNEEHLKDQLSCEDSSEDGASSRQFLPLTLRGQEEQPIFNPFQVYRQSCEKVFNQVCGNLKPWLHSIIFTCRSYYDQDNDRG
ncbi:Kiaa0825 [Columba guinea]|nr:Kiaa0825 [Columba guinea]